MGFIDRENLYSNDQAITATAASTDIIDHGDDDSKIQSFREVGGKSTIQAFVTESFNTCDGLTIALQSCAAEGFGSGVVTHRSVLKARTALVAGAPIEIGDLPNDLLQYSRLYYTVSGSNPTLGKIHAGIVVDKQTNGVL